MPRAWQTPHGARPNREGIPPIRARAPFVRMLFPEWAGRVPARRAQPPGRSLELRSNAQPRGMTVLPDLGRQNSAYRSGCLTYCISVTYRDIARLASSKREENSRSQILAWSATLVSQRLNSLSVARGGGYRGWTLLERSIDTSRFEQNSGLSQSHFVG